MRIPNFTTLFAKVKYKLADLKNPSGGFRCILTYKAIRLREGGGLRTKCVGNQAAAFTLMMCGFAPSYQYRKASMSTTSPAFSSPTVVYTSVSVPVRYTSTQKL